MTNNKLYDLRTVTYEMNIKESFENFIKNIGIFNKEFGYFNPRWEMIEAASAISIDRKADFSTIIDQVTTRKTNLSKLFSNHLIIFDYFDIKDIRLINILSKELLMTIYSRMINNLILKKEDKNEKFRATNKENDAIDFMQIDNELDELFEYINSKEDDDNIMIKIAIILFRIMYIRPFNNHNYYVGSILIKYILEFKGYKGFYFLFNISNIFLKEKEMYKKKISQISNGNINQWIRYYLESSCKFMDLFDKQVKVMVEYKNKCIRNIGYKETELIFKRIFVTTNDIKESMNYSSRNSQRVLNELINNGTLVGDEKERYKEAASEKVLAFYYMFQSELVNALNENKSIDDQIVPETKGGKMHLEKRGTYRVLVYD